MARSHDLLRLHPPHESILYLAGAAAWLIPLLFFSRVFRSFFVLFFKGAYGDRRQELVFIGIGMSEEATRGPIVKALDECLLTDEEMKIYEEARKVCRCFVCVCICHTTVLYFHGFEVCVNGTLEAPTTSQPSLSLILCETVFLSSPHVYTVPIPCPRSPAWLISRGCVASFSVVAGLPVLVVVVASQ